jgi:hypothetical protein
MRKHCLRNGLLLLAGMLGWGAGDSGAAMVFGSVWEDTQTPPIPGAWVYLRHLPGKEADSLQSDSAGAYAFSDVTGCESGCDIEVRSPGYWFYVSDPFMLPADGIKQADVRLLRIHDLSVRVVKAEDTSQAIVNSQAVLFSAANEEPRCGKADSAGRFRFNDLQTSTGYRLTVAAPGRKTSSNELHFHDAVSHIFFPIVLDSDAAGTNKSLRGTLSAKGAGPSSGQRVILTCSNERIAADLFTETGAGGAYAIQAVPADCDSVMLYAGRDSAAAALTGMDNQLDWSALFPVPDFARRRGAARVGIPLRPALWRDYDAAGRKLNPVRLIPP